MPKSLSFKAGIFQRKQKKGRGKEKVFDFTERKVNRIFNKLSELTGISGRIITPTGLRHTFAERLLESEVPASVVSEMMGHSSVEFTLKTYGRATGQEIKNYLSRTWTHE